MKVSQSKQTQLITVLHNLNNTVGKDIKTIIKAEKELKDVLPKNITYDYDDCMNTWYYTTLSGKELNSNFEIIK